MIGTSSITTTTILLLVVTGAIQSWTLPKTVCTSPVGLQSTSKPTTVVGTGTAASCNQAALAAALLKGGIITFNCGKSGVNVTIPVTSELQVATGFDTLIDGGGTVTLDGQGKTRIFRFNRLFYTNATPIFTVQQLRLINGYCQDNGGGCAIYQQNGGTTRIINCIFENNIGAVTGQDTAGGAVWTLGGGDTTVINSVFRGNKCSNGGGLGILGSGLLIYNSHFESNQATGKDGNPGLGGNGGAISFDGRGRNNTICGTRFTKNQANKFGGTFFRVSYNGNETNNFDNVLIDSNLVVQSGNGAAGALYIQGGTARIRNATIYNNSATTGGAVFFSNEKAVELRGVNLIGNQANTQVGGTFFCSNPVTGTLSGLTVANNYAGVLGAAFFACTTTLTMANSIIANNTVGNVYSANACSTAMNDGTGNIQAPINKLSPAKGIDPACTNGTSTPTRVANITVTLDTTTWKIKVIGATPVYLGPAVVPGL